jgi:hypothetical protein
MRIFRFKVTFFLRPYGFDPSKDDSLKAKLSIIKAYFDNLIKIRPDLPEKGVLHIHIFPIHGLTNEGIRNCNRDLLSVTKEAKKVNVKK